LAVNRDEHGKALALQYQENYIPHDGFVLCEKDYPTAHRNSFVKRLLILIVHESLQE